MWPYSEDDHMEIGETGWVSVGEGVWRNRISGYFIDEMGIEYNSEGDRVTDPDE